METYKNEEIEYELGPKNEFYVWSEASESHLENHPRTLSLSLDINQDRGSDAREEQARDKKTFWAVRLIYYVNR